MDRLFHIVTDRVTLSFSALTEPPLRSAIATEPGLLRIEPLRPGIAFQPGMFRAGVPRDIAADPAITLGPILHEEAQYRLYARARPGSTVRVIHPDPVFTQRLGEEDGGGTVHGVVSFGSQIGRTAFTVAIDDIPEIRIEVEVFPSKLDYRSDYEAILADVQEILTGLALEYLRSTYQLGRPRPAPAPTDLEWILLLRSVVGDLARALEQIARRPAHRLDRSAIPVRADRVKRVDASVRSRVRRGAGAGGFLAIGAGIRVRDRIAERRPTPTLDTPEHRFLAAEVARIERRLAAIRRAVAASPGAGPRRRRALADLAALDARLRALSRLEPLAMARGEPPAGFASLSLLTSPGYREAYRACLVLSLGLRIEGGPLALSVKDLSLLYEYWCYLATVRILGEITGQRAEIRDLFAIRSAGIEVRLAPGRESEARIDAASGRRISLRYNPLLDHADALIPQRPDLLLTITDPGWPPQEIILDAKYRIDLSPGYRARHGSPGPPDDAINALHRYRDAILERRGNPPTRTVVQAAALFPYRDDPDDDFAESRLFRGLSRVGIGAVPLLPGDTAHLRRFLGGAILHGPWALADRVPDHASIRRSAVLKQKAAETVLVGTSARVDLIRDRRRFYVPLTPGQRRQLVARWLAIYTPASRGRRGAVTHVAAITSFEVIDRRDIDAPWAIPCAMDARVIAYALGPLDPISPAIENRDDASRQRHAAVCRWSSRLALERASVIAELALETEPEWRLYEELRARGAAFHVEPIRARFAGESDPRGRAWFRGEAGWSARYMGGAGFAWSFSEGAKVHYLAHPEDVAEAMTRASSPADRP